MVRALLGYCTSSVVTAAMTLAATRGNPTVVSRLQVICRIIRDPEKAAFKLLSA